ncbi:unnamed protein product, partial [Ectocarpus sp. 4 AP-2014]
TSEPVDHGVSRACGRHERARRREPDEVRRGRKHPHVSTDGFVKVISSAAWRQWTCPSRRGIHEAAGAVGQTVTTLIISTGSVHAEVVESVTSEPRPGVAVGIAAVAPEPKVDGARAPWVLVKDPPNNLLAWPKLPYWKPPQGGYIRSDFGRDSSPRMEKSARPTVGTLRVSTDGFVKVISSAAWRQWVCPSWRGIHEAAGAVGQTGHDHKSLDRLGPCRGR